MYVVADSVIIPVSTLQMPLTVLVATHVIVVDSHIRLCLFNCAPAEDFGGNQRPRDIASSETVNGHLDGVAARALLIIPAGDRGSSRDAWASRMSGSGSGRSRTTNAVLETVMYDQPAREAWH
jgi:hypothetical protein